ncbi:MAG: hypothetical protein F6K21_05695 [Symploca sp. SIO2D2]|nr:hypothetical protein [Symploca sp. SIO2D2]
MTKPKFKGELFIIEAGFSGEYYSPKSPNLFSPIKGEAKTYIREGYANTAAYNLRFNTIVKELRRKGKPLRVRPDKKEFLQLELNLNGTISEEINKDKAIERELRMRSPELAGLINLLKALAQEDE